MRIGARKLLRVYKVQFAILFFLLIFSGYHYFKPGISYDSDGSFRPFGIGFKHKSVVPVWLVAIFIAILSYTFVLYLLSL